MNLISPIARSLSLSLATGYILFFFSERIFWSFLRPDDEFVVILGGWLIYSLFAYLTLAVMRLSRASSVWGIVIAGAFFGWLLEGSYAMTLYGDPSIPFPLTLAWTGLAWHQLVSVVIGLFGLRQCLRSHGIAPTLAVAFGIAAFWGFWATGWSQETPPLVASASSFFIHAVVATAGLILSEWALSKGGADSFAPSKLSLGLFSSLLGVFFLAVVTPAIPWAPLVLLPLIGVTLWGLRLSAARDVSHDAVSQLSKRIELRNLACLAVIPVVATVVYRFLIHRAWNIPAHQIVAGAFGAAGVAIFARAMCGAFGRRNAVSIGLKES